MIEIDGADQFIDVVVSGTIGELVDDEHLTTTLIIGTKLGSVMIKCSKELVAEPRKR